MTELCFASNNEHKLREVRQMVGPDFSVLSLQDIGCSDDIPETRDTIEGNALQKAEYVVERFGIPCFADDSGLEVMALNGEPGVVSARYAGAQRNDLDNIALLLKRLVGVEDRRARFKTVIAYMDGDFSRTFVGIMNGRIITSRRGSNGFGYDPIFMPDGFDSTFAEMTSELKNSISHRGKAMAAFASFLQSREIL